MAMAVLGFGCHYLIYNRVILNGFVFWWPDPIYFVVLALGFICPVVWIILTSVAFFLIRWRASWLLLSAPPALFGPVWLLILIRAINACEALPPGEVDVWQMLPQPHIVKREMMHQVCTP